MLYLTLTVLCSFLVTVILKAAQMRGHHPLALGLPNYIFASLFASVQPLAAGAEFNVKSLLLALVVGLSFLAGIQVFMRAIAVMGLAIPTSIARISLVIPVVGSVLLFNDTMNERSLAGVATGIAAFVTLGIAQGRRKTEAGTREGRSIKGATVYLLFGVFMITGLCDLSMKVAQTLGAASGWYLPCVFGAAALYTGIQLLLPSQRVRVRGRDVSAGFIMALPNYLGCLFVIRALADGVPGVIVFPVVGAGTVVTATVASVLIWKESPGALAWTGIGLATLAVALLGMAN